MKNAIVRYIGQTSPLELTRGRQYELLSIERGWFRVRDDTGETYLYPASLFKTVAEATEQAPSTANENPDD